MTFTDWITVITGTVLLIGFIILLVIIWKIANLPVEK